MRLQFSAFVENDLAEIADFIAKDNPERALSFVKELRAAIMKIPKNPFGYRMRPDIAKDARMAVFGRYVILFRIRGGNILVDRVLHGARDLPEFML